MCGEGGTSCSAMCVRSVFTFECVCVHVRSINVCTWVCMCVRTYVCVHVSMSLYA